MTRLWTDGFEFKDLLGYCVAPLGVDITTTVKRSGNASAMFSKSGPGEIGWFSFSFGDVSEFYLRVGLYVSNTTVDWPRIEWLNGSTSVGFIDFVNCNQASIYVDSVLKDTGTTALFDSIWYLFEVHVKLSATIGVIELRLDGVTALEASFSGNTGTGTIDTIKFSTNYSGLGDINTGYVDDIALNDTAGGVDDSWCGEGKIIVMMPNDDSTPLELTPSAASDHHLLVDEVPTDGDTTYVEGSVIDEEDMYGLTPSGLVDVDINRVWTEARTKKTAAADGKVALITKAAGGAEVSGGDVEILTTYSIKVLGAEELENPVDSNPWEVADIDLIEIGPRTR